MHHHVGPIGFDFGTRYLRMVQLVGEGERFAVVGCAQQIVPLEIKSRAEYELIVMSSVDRMLREGHFSGRDVVTSLGWNDLQIRNLRLNAAAEGDLEDNIRRQAAESFDMDPVETEFRFLPAGDVRHGTDMQQEVIVLGASRTAIENHLALLNKLGLNPVAIDAGPCALFRSFERFMRRGEDDDQVHALLDMGYEATRVVISRGTDLILFKSIPLGGRHFDRLLGQRLDLSRYEASEIRMRVQRNRSHLDARETGEIDPAPESLHRAVFDALRPAFEQIGKEITLCLRYCSATFRGQRCEMVTMVGGQAGDRAMRRFLADQVGLPFEVGRPMRNMVLDCGGNTLDRRAGQPEWAMATGLALKPLHRAAEVMR